MLLLAAWSSSLHSAGGLAFAPLRSAAAAAAVLWARTPGEEEELVHSGARVHIRGLVWAPSRHGAAAVPCACACPPPLRGGGVWCCRAPCCAVPQAARPAHEPRLHLAPPRELPPPACAEKGKSRAACALWASVPVARAVPARAVLAPRAPSGAWLPARGRGGASAPAACLGLWRTAVLALLQQVGWGVWCAVCPASSRAACVPTPQVTACRAEPLSPRQATAATNPGFARLPTGGARKKARATGWGPACLCARAWRCAARGVRHSATGHGVLG